MKIQIKPLSVNECWKGRRYKTDKYKLYERNVASLLKRINLPAAPYEVHIEFGFSNIGADTDNPVKPFVDILQKCYGFNDNKIWKYILTKKKVKKGEEYIDFEIKELK